MVENFTEKFTKEDIVASPVDETLSGVITQIHKGVLKEFLDIKVHEKFDNLDQETLKIDFEVKFNDMIIKGNDRIAYYKEPMSNSKLGKFLKKYGEFKIGVEIKVNYDGEGFGKISVK